MTTKKLNIVFLSSWYPNRVQPTLGNFVQKHAEAVALQSSVAALNVCSDETNKKTFETAINETNNVFTVNVYFKKTTNPILKTFRYIKAHKIGFEVIKNKFKKIDLVHQNILFPSGYIAYKLKKKYNIPYIITEHWTGYLPSKKSRQGFIESYLSKKIALNASLITAVSTDLKNAMLSLGLSNNYKIVHNVVDTHLFIPPLNKKNTAKIKFLHISHLNDEHKNISGMLRVVERLAKVREDFEFYFIGDGDTKPYEQIAKKNNTYNSFAFFDGTKSTLEIAELMKQSDCFVLFSNYENMPVVISEAMACGLPIISSNVGGISEHVSSNFGTLVKSKNENELQEALNRMIEDIRSNKYNSIEINNYAKANFSYENVCKQFHAIYFEVLKNV